jgi:hypothetical protein
MTCNDSSLYKYRGYLRDPNSTRDRKVRRQSLKYTLINNELYRRTIEGLLLRCLDDEHASIAVGEVHEGLCGAHQLAPKMKWAIRRVGLYCPMMMSDCVQEGLWCLSEVQWHTVSSDQCTSFNCKAMAIQGVGLRFHWWDTPILIKGAPVRPSCYRLFHKMDGGRATKEHDSQGGDKFHTRAHYISVWSPSDFDDRSTGFLLVTSVQRVPSDYINSLIEQ